jgi:hypothetical protein
MSTQTVVVHDHRHPRSRFLKLAEQRYGRLRAVDSIARVVAAQRAAGVSTTTLAAPRLPNAAGGDVVQVGDQPKGFGVFIDWASDEDLAVICFINVSDDLGVAVGGVRDTDTFELMNARGSATFNIETDNEGIPGLISIAAAGANLTAGALGVPELGPLINAGSAYAKKRFAEKVHAGKVRNSFGEDDNGGRARQEGGVIVNMPRARTNFTSGNDESRWIQHDGRRVPQNFPRHIPANEAFFLRKDMGIEILRGNGEMALSAWDHGSFKADNSGFYRVSFLLRRGTGEGPIIE